MLGARLALVTTLLLTGCGVPLGGTAPPERATAPRGTVRVTRVTRGEIAGVITYSGDLRSKPGALVSSRISGRLERLHVEVGSPVREGDTLAELDRASLEVQVVQSEASLAAAEARLAGLKAGGEPDAREEAEARLRAARARLTGLENGPPAETVPLLAQNVREARRRLAELEGNNGDAIAQAEARLGSARGRLDQILTAAAGSLTGTPTTASLVGVDQARADIRRAEQDLARARRPITSEEVAGARQQVATAETELMLARNPVGPADLEEARATLEAAEARLRRAGAPATDTTIRAAESAVDYAWAALELARLQLREATIQAPINGVVAQTHQLQGSPVAAGSPLVAIQPPDFELVLAVDERQLALVDPGQGVTISVDAYPGESFSGTVRSVAPAVDARTRTLATKVDVVDPRLKLKAGLFAQAAIAGARKQNALLLPREAILVGPDPAVMQVVDGRARRHPVQVGATDGRNVEILQGLPDGAEVAIGPSLSEGDLVAER